MQAILQNMLLSASFEDWLIGIFNMIPKFIYFICVSLMSVVDLLQYVLRKLAGLDTYYVNGVKQSGDIVINFIKGVFIEDSPFPAIKNAFWSLVIFGILLLIVATIIAIIRQEYSPSGEDMKDKPSNNKMNIIVRSVKSLFLFLIVPVSCFLGLMLCDLTLYTLDSITTSADIGGTLVTSVNSNLLEEAELSNGKSSYIYYDIFGQHMPTSAGTFSGSMFKVAAYEANRVRLDEDIFQGLHQNTVENFNLFNQSENQEECALMIDEAFAHCVKLKTPTGIKVEGTLLDGIANSNLAFSIKDGKQVTHFSKFNVGLVFYYYNLWYFNFIIAFAFLVICLKLFVNIVIGLMKRIVELIALFIISPPIVAIMPLDGGKAFSNWRQNFVSKSVSVIATVVGMNVLFLLLPYLNQIQLFDPLNKGMHLLNLIISALCILVGLSMVESFIALVSGLIGAEDMAKVGAEISTKVGDTLAQSAKFTGATAGLAVKPTLFAGSLAAKGLGAAGRAVGGKVGSAIGDRLNKRGALRTGKADYDYKVDGKLVPALAKMKSGLTSLKDLPGKIFTGKARRDASDSFAQAWQNGGAEQAYNDYLSQSDDFNQAMNQKYLNRSNRYKAMSFEDWSKTTKEGLTARDDVASAVGLESWSSFKNAVKVETDDKGKTKIVEDINSEATKMFRQSRDKHIKEAAKQVNAQIGRGFIKYSGVKNIASMSSLYFEQIKSAFVPSGKGGFISMMRAFQGQTAKQIEQAEWLKKVQKEEAAKVQAQEAARKKLEGVEGQTQRNTADIDKNTKKLRKMEEDKGKK